VVKDVEMDLRSRMETDLKEKGWPQEYTIDELGEKYLLLDWLGCNLIFDRPLRTKQLFLYRAPSTQKSFMFEMLKSVLNIYFADVKKNGLAGAHDSYDLWVLDPIFVAIDDTSLPWEWAEKAAATRSLLGILDGQEYRLDGPNRRQFTKKRNVPVVAITNIPSISFRFAGPDRFIRLPFCSRIPSLHEERVIATL